MAASRFYAHIMIVLPAFADQVCKNANPYLHYFNLLNNIIFKGLLKKNFPSSLLFISAWKKRSLSLFFISRGSTSTQWSCSLTTLIFSHTCWRRKTNLALSTFCCENWDFLVGSNRAPPFPSGSGDSSYRAWSNISRYVTFESLMVGIRNEMMTSNIFSGRLTSFLFGPLNRLPFQMKNPFQQTDSCKWMILKLS